MLGGSFGRNSRHTSAISDVTASACEDTCRINFIRNDLLLWTTHRSDFNRARECDKLLKADAFVQRTARDAHILVLATGHHFPASMEAAALAGGGTAGRASSFITGSLNHTLFNLRRARARYGHAPESVALIGTSIPVPSCSRFSGTLEAADWLRVEASMAGGSKYTPRWRQMHRINALLRWLAEAHGASFVDIAAPSSRWPGGMMARYTRDAGSVGEDCLHSCMPGPIDTWIRVLIENLIPRRHTLRGGSPQGSAGSGAADSGGPRVDNHTGNAGGRRLRGGRSMAGHAPGPWSDGAGRFFKVPSNAWLRERNSGSQFESHCSGVCVRADGIAKEAWWPFTECTRKRSQLFCDGGECRPSSRKAVIRLCDSQGVHGCSNLTVGALRAAAAHELLRS
jgi:hypothetical protein